MLLNDSKLFSLGPPVTDPPSYDLAILQGFNDIVDLFFFELFTDQLIKHEIPFHGHISKPWYVQMGVDFAVHDAYQVPLLIEVTPRPTSSTTPAAS